MIRAIFRWLRWPQFIASSAAVLGLGDDGRVTQQDLITTVKTTQHSLVVQHVSCFEVVVACRFTGRRCCGRRRVDGLRQSTVDGSGVRRRDSFLATKNGRHGWYAGGGALSVCRRGWCSDGGSRGWPLALDARHPLVASWNANWLPTCASAIRRRLLLLLLNTAVNISIVAWRSQAVTSINHVHSVCRMKSWPRRTLAWCAAVRRRADVIIVRFRHSGRHHSTFYVNTLERRPTGTRLAVRTRLHKRNQSFNVNTLSA